MSDVRQTAVAGMFYPGRADVLERTVRELLEAAPEAGSCPKALIAPHAGYVYSGAVAATGYRRVATARGRIERVVLAGPAHRYPLRGIATHSARAFATPLGEVPVDAGSQGIPGVRALDAAHDGEHSLEVHLPFLQIALGHFTLIPLLVGEASPAEVADVLDHVWGGEETLIVVSSDLSHFHDMDAARRRDAQTARTIEALDVDAVGPYDACGCRPVCGLMTACARRGIALTTLDLRNSGDTAGDPHRVVGYGTFVTV